jgi:predicted PurR-regulated permease PerM
MRRTIGNATAAATIALSITTLCVIVPGLVLGRTIAQYALIVGRILRNGNFQTNMLAELDHHAGIVSMLQHASSFLAWSKAAERVGAFLATYVVSMLSNSASALAQTIVMLFLLFFLYRDGEGALRFIYLLLPMEESEARALVKGVEETIRATFLGRFAVAAVQGLIAGIVFALLGVDGAVLLGILTAMAAILPYFGAYVVWMPVAAYLGLSGHWIKTIVLVAVGTLIISTLDNFLYPMLVGAQLRQHTAIIFLAVLGGIWLFGIPGLILGPILFSMASTLLSIWRARYHTGSSSGAPEFPNKLAR